MSRLFLILALTCASTAWADHDERFVAQPFNQKWKTECGACHLAYPPALLPERSWRKIMSGLERHFGQDASLDAATAAEIADFLAANSADRRQGKRASKVMRSLGANDVPLRISQTPWFRHEHDEISPRTWARAKIGSPANCVACHQGAETGDYSEHRVRIPT